MKEAYNFRLIYIAGPPLCPFLPPSAKHTSSQVHGLSESRDQWLWLQRTCQGIEWLTVIVHYTPKIVKTASEMHVAPRISQIATDWPKCFCIYTGVHICILCNKAAISWPSSWKPLMETSGKRYGWLNRPPSPPLSLNRLKYSLIWCLEQREVNEISFGLNLLKSNLINVMS